MVSASSHFGISWHTYCLYALLKSITTNEKKQDWLEEPHWQLRKERKDSLFFDKLHLTPSYFRWHFWTFLSDCIIWIDSVGSFSWALASFMRDAHLLFTYAKISLSGWFHWRFLLLLIFWLLSRFPCCECFRHSGRVIYKPCFQTLQLSFIHKLRSWQTMSYNNK